MSVHLFRPLFILFLALAGVAQPVEEDSTTVVSRYEQALALFERGAYAKSKAVLEQLSTDTDLSPGLLDNCYFWIGECYYAEEAYLDAIACFFKVLDYPRANKAEAAHMKIALAWYNLGERDKSCRETRRLIRLHPEGEYLARARRLQRLVCRESASGGE